MVSSGVTTASTSSPSPASLDSSSSSPSAPSYSSISSNNSSNMQPSPFKLSSLLAVSLSLAVLSTTASAISYQPVAYSSTALLGSRLYIYGGVTNLTSPLSPASYSTQFATLSLTNSFDTDSLPWEFLPGSSIPRAMSPGAASRDQRRFIVGGSGNNLGNAPAMVFDSTSRTWSQVEDLPRTEGSSVMQGYRRYSPGMTLDTTTGMLVVFGGVNATSLTMDSNSSSNVNGVGVTNVLTVLDTNKASNLMSWSYSGTLETVPALYTPIVLYIPTIKSILILGGCDQLDATASNMGTNTAVHCAAFDTVYTLSSDSVVSKNPKASKIPMNTTLPMPTPRLMPCAVVLPDGNVLMLGGGAPGSGTAMADAWILNTQNWTWFKRDIGGAPQEGIMGHSCLLASHDQVLVIGGHAGGNFVQYPLSVIKMQNWAWTGRYWVPGFSTGVKVGLAMSVVVVVGAIVAGLWMRWRRIKMAALAKAQHDNGHGHKIKMRQTSRTKRPGQGSHRRQRSSQQHQHQHQHHDHQHQHHHHHQSVRGVGGQGGERMELEGVERCPGAHAHDESGGHVPQLNFTLAQENPNEHSSREHGAPPYDQTCHLAVDAATYSPIGSSSSTIVGPSSLISHDEGVWLEEGHARGRFEQGGEMEQGRAAAVVEVEEERHEMGSSPDLKTEIA